MKLQYNSPVILTYVLLCCGVLVLDMAYGSTVAENADGGWDITVDYGQMGQKTYTMTAQQVKAIVK